MGYKGKAWEKNNVIEENYQQIHQQIPILPADVFWDVMGWNEMWDLRVCLLQCLTRPAWLFNEDVIRCSFRIAWK